MRWKKWEPRPKTYWIPWFAWFPVVLECTGETAWLERVWRHDEVGQAGTRYRADVHWGGANLQFNDSTGHRSQYR